MPDEHEATIINMDVVSYDVTTAEIANLREKYAGFAEKDLDDPEEYALVKTAQMDLKKLRVSIEKRRKSLKSDAFAYGKKVDSAAKEITEPIIAIEQPIAKARKDHDMKEEIERREKERLENERIEQCTNRLQAIKQAASVAVTKDVSYVKAVIEKLTATSAKSFDEFSGDAEIVIKDALDSLNALVEMKEAQEKMAAETAKREAEEAVAKAAKEKEDEKKRLVFEAEQKKLREAQEALRRDQEEVARKKQEVRDEEEAKAEEEAKQKFERDKARLIEKEERERLAEKNKNLTNVQNDLRNHLAEMKLFSSNKKIQIFMDAVQADEIPNLKFYL